MKILIVAEHKNGALAEATRELFGLSIRQAEIHAVVAGEAVAPLVDRTLATADGFESGRSALIAFGQTGSGKTHTCMAMQQRVARALLDAPDVGALGVSFLEICGEHVADLLCDSGSPVEAQAVSALSQAR